MHRVTSTSLVNFEAIGYPFTVRPTRTRVETTCSAYSAGKSSNLEASPKSWMDFSLATSTLWYSAMTGWNKSENVSYASGSIIVII